MDSEQAVTLQVPNDKWQQWINDNKPSLATTCDKMYSVVLSSDEKERRTTVTAEHVEKAHDEGTLLVKKLKQDCVELFMNALSATEPQNSQESVESEFQQRLKKLGDKYHIVSGKWSAAYPTKDIDFFWTRVVEALASTDGALAKTGKVHRATVSGASDSGQHAMLISCDNSDREAIEKVFKALVKECAVLPEVYVPDIFLVLGLTVEEVPPTPFKPSDFMTEEEIITSLRTKGQQFAEQIASNQEASSTGETEMSLEESLKLYQRFSNFVTRLNMEKIRIENGESVSTAEQVRQSVDHWLKSFEESDQDPLEFKLIEVGETGKPTESSSGNKQDGTAKDSQSGVKVLEEVIKIMSQTLRELEQVPEIGDQLEVKTSEMTLESKEEGE